MEIPDLVRQALGDEEVTAGVNLGDEDAVCFTPTRTLVYRGEGLLSDEGVGEYAHDFERLSISEGRRKTKFTMTYVDDKDSFAVPGKRTSAVLERLLEGNLRVKGVIADDEGVSGVFRFSELTLVVTDSRLLKHIGEYTWAGDFEAYHYDDVTGLHFEEGSVATAVVLEADGRPERIKAPNDQAGLFRKTLEGSLFAYHDVDSLGELNHALEVDETDGETDDEEASPSGSDGLGLDSGIDPLVGDDEDAEPSDERPAAAAGQRQSAASISSQSDATDTRQASPTADGTTNDADIAAVEEQLAALTETIEQQNELLAKQQQTIKQLIKELRQGR
ncbi:hypothetical protein ACAH01_12205 [Halomicrobium sp. HM KBTZ05]|uniref:DUF7115 domain-containing protein n=1 Tax=Halomicrobium sp. HM KBTZ05 TaxID=3242663 RepID=UPI003558649D